MALGNQFFSRPILRTCITYAQWSDAFVGQAGGPDYMHLHGGFTWGLQMETWWQAGAAAGQRNCQMNFERRARTLRSSGLRLGRVRQPVNLASAPREMSVTTIPSLPDPSRS